MTDSDRGTPEKARDKILELLDQRGPGKTICPSDAARALAGDADFRPLMNPVRAAADKLAKVGRVEITQKGKPVEIGKVRGPIRIGPPRKD